MYCKRDNYIHRKIILNSLIAEKLLAVEAGDSSALARTPYFQAYLRGRKEQSMRQWLFYNDFYRKARVAESDIDERYRLAGRNYTISYFTVTGGAEAEAAARAMRDSSSFRQTFERLTGSADLPQRRVTFSEVESGGVLDALYSGAPAKHQVIGPVADESGYTFIFINGWTERVYLSGEEQARQRQDIEKYLRRTEGERAYRAFVSRLMKGRRLEFVEATYRALIPAVAGEYVKTPGEKRDAFNQRFWGKDADTGVLDESGAVLERISDDPLFSVDGEIWTVRRLQDELVSHPLVFRKRSMSNADFAEEFKLAVADLIRDRHITAEAYKRGYDTVPEVQRNAGMWRDNLLAIYERNRWLEERGKKQAFESALLSTLENDLDPYIRSLMQRYSDRIEIDTDAFEAITLSRIDSFMLQRNVPFPVMVPSFPIVTTHDRLDYGRKMDR
ncbi:hypothetical protein JXO52_01895 [bacterium]|nr:hypothetical protein [bacterium]